jgi:uncharacterized protein (DUF302 family)
MSLYGFSKRVDAGFEHVISRVKESLKNEGFGVLCEIDVRDTLKKKLDVEFRKYVILGACNPPLAHKALSAEIEIGLLLPCNVIVYENDDHGVTVSAINAEKMLGVVGREDLESISSEVNRRLVKVIETV